MIRCSSGPVSQLQVQNLSSNLRDNQWQLDCRRSKVLSSSNVFRQGQVVTKSGYKPDVPKVHLRNVEKGASGRDIFNGSHSWDVANKGYRTN